MAQENGIEDGMILLDSEAGTKLGFTCDRFTGWLWKKGDYIVISCITSLEKGNGNFIRLLERIRKRGYGIMVPTASREMERICKKRDFKKTEEKHEGELYEIWKLEPPQI